MKTPRSHRREHLPVITSFWPHDHDEAKLDKVGFGRPGVPPGFRLGARGLLTRRLFQVFQSTIRIDIMLRIVNYISRVSVYAHNYKQNIVCYIFQVFQSTHT